MPTLKEIKGRIGSVKSTLKITTAMKMVASAKLHKAQGMIEGMLPYERELNRMLEALLKDVRPDPRYQESRAPQRTVSSPMCC